MNEQERHGEGERTATAWLFGFMIGALVLALMGSAYLIGFNRGQDEARDGRQRAEPAATQPPPAPPSGPGLDLFAENCGSCHTLSAADTSDTVGPNLDELQPDEAQVLAAIENGGTGSGTMPAKLLTGAEADQVAGFVAANAGP